MAKIIGDYQIKEKLGKGSFASVYLGIHLHDNRKYAIKIISKELIQSEPKLAAGLESEIRIMTDFIHPHIVRLYRNYANEKYYYLVLEYCPGGDLARYIRKIGRLSEVTALRFLHQLAEGLSFLKEKNFIHRDLKPANVLLSEFSDNAMVKLADFGFARYLAGEASLAQTRCGTPLYMAPEILQNKSYDFKADIWSVGCIFYEMLVGKCPFRGQNEIDLLTNIRTQELRIPDDVSVTKAHMDIIGKLLERDCARRPSIEQLLAVTTNLLSMLPPPATSSSSSSEPTTILNQAASPPSSLPPQTSPTLPSPSTTVFPPLPPAPERSPLAAVFATVPPEPTTPRSATNPTFPTVSGEVQPSSGSGRFYPQSLPSPSGASIPNSGETRRPSHDERRPGESTAQPPASSNLADMMHNMNVDARKEHGGPPAASDDDFIFIEYPVRKGSFGSAPADVAAFQSASNPPAPDNSPSFSEMDLHFLAQRCAHTCEAVNAVINIADRCIMKDSVLYNYCRSKDEEDVGKLSFSSPSESLKLACRACSLYLHALQLLQNLLSWLTSHLGVSQTVDIFRKKLLVAFGFTIERAEKCQTVIGVLSTYASIRHSRGTVPKAENIMMEEALVLEREARVKMQLGDLEQARYEYLFAVRLLRGLHLTAITDSMGSYSEVALDQQCNRLESELRDCETHMHELGLLKRVV